MNPMPLLLALLVVAYIGSLYTSGDRKRSFGSASGVEFVMLGALLGPHALGALNSQAVHAFDPLALLALGWIGLGYGVEWGMNGERRAPLGRVLLGCLLTGLVSAAVGASVYFVAHLAHWLAPAQRELAAAAAALVSAETTRHAVRWVSERRVVVGPLSTLLGDVAAADDAPVMIGVIALLARHTGVLQVAGFQVEVWASALGTLGIGVILGLVCAYLTYRDRSTVTAWSSLLGCACLAAGFTTSLGLSAMGATFTMGLTLSLASPIGAEMRAKIMRTEGSLLLPALLLAGARLELPQGKLELGLIGVALLARVLASYVVGATIALTRAPFRRATPWLGLAMTSSGTLTMMVGLAFSVRLDADVGRFVLSCAALGTLVGELMGPLAMLRALDRAGEVSPLPVKPEAEAEAEDSRLEVMP
jgi:Kef-type K+ transport system membrane component KefB